MQSNRIVQNAKWIVLCKVAQSFLQMIIGILSARYLGPANYGLINYAASVVAFTVPFMELGMSGILVQEYLGDPEKEGAVMGTSLIMNVLSGLVCMVCVVGFVSVANPGDRTAITVCALYSVCLLFQALEMTKYWFQANLQSKYSSIAGLIAYSAVAIYKLYLLIAGKSVNWFALSHSVEFGIVSMLQLLIYKRIGTSKLCFSWPLAKKMFAKSKYYIMASMTATVFQNTDHVMLKLMVGDADNGFYTAAVICTVTVHFVYTAIIDSGRPVIMESKRKSQEEYENNMARLYSILIFLSIAQSLAFTIFAVPIVGILYGKAYMAAVPVLRIVVWMQAFSYIGYVRNIWILCEAQYSILWKINLAGALANVALNAAMIPLWGACGAALASVGTQFFANVVMGFILKPIRENNRLMLKGCNPKLLIELYGLLRQK